MNDSHEHDADLQRRKSSRIPDFASVEVEAEFWDTHDLTDFLDELHPVSIRVSPNLSSGMTIRLDPADRDALGRIAAEQGVGPSPLARIWIKERLRELAS